MILSHRSRGLRRAVALISMMFLSACSHTPKHPADGMFTCYQGIRWYSWTEPFNGGEAMVLGPKQRDGVDAQFVLLPGFRGQNETLRQGLYLFTEDEVYFYRFPAIPEPDHDYQFRLDFESPDGDLRKLWVKYAAPSGKAPALEVYSGWPGDVRSLRLEGEPARDAQAELVFANEIVRFIRGFKPTLARQRDLASGSPLKPAIESIAKGFTDRLNLCGAIENAQIKAAVRQEQQPAPSSSPALLYK